MVFVKKQAKLMWIVLLGSVILISSCNSFEKNKSHRKVPDTNISKGKILAAAYCQSCHLLPDPSLLDSKDWEKGVLPSMGPRLGIFNYGFIEYPSSIRDRNLEKDFYPAKPLLNLKEWQYIIDYYTSVSPEILPIQQRKYPVLKGASLFKVETPPTTQTLAATCLVKIDTSVSPGQLMVADAISNNIYRFNNRLVPVDSIKTISPVVDVEINQHDIISCNMGVMNPNNGKFGRASQITIDGNRKMIADTSFTIDKLARPVQISSADFNLDGKADYLACEYGNLQGALSWFENMGGNNYERHVLRNTPGAIKAYLRDVNNDGLPDIWVLFAQGDESIYLFTNKGYGKFEQEQLLQFPSIFGSSYFELADFNKDGYQDIIYTCGDNADFSPVLKPYHGLYIFLNDGKNHFKQEYFFPMYGCFKAMARDFDGDGDLDIAAISFFADYATHPEESFLYLENKGSMDFQPNSIPGTTSGRWLTMDAADLDGDGKTDLVLGNFSIAPTLLKSSTNWKEGPPFIVLKNIIKK